MTDWTEAEERARELMAYPPGTKERSDPPALLARDFLALKEERDELAAWLDAGYAEGKESERLRTALVAALELAKALAVSHPHFGVPLLEALRGDTQD